MVACVAQLGCEEAGATPRPNCAANHAYQRQPKQLRQRAAVAAAPLLQHRPATPAARLTPPARPASRRRAVEREKAEAGVGRRGSGYGGGIITEPVHQYFAGKDRITFEIEIPKAMKLFQAEHNRYPKNLAEFQREILDPSQIVLPDLSAGDQIRVRRSGARIDGRAHAPGGQWSQDRVNQDSSVVIDR